MNDNRCNEEEDEINGSIIGTKDYWEECYEKELQNYSEFGDFGEIWFGLKNNRKIVEWIRDNIRHKLDVKILDIGCGNGLLLIDLAKLGYKQLFGADYSHNSIKFCQQMAVKELKTTDVSIVFEELDILSDTIVDSIVLKHKFDCLIDKGTYDAICLMPNTDITQIRDKYLNFVLKIMTENSIFLLMSCNFTKTQLFKDLKINNSFDLIHEMESPVFSFGGQSGSQVTGLVLKRI